MTASDLLTTFETTHPGKVEWSKVASFNYGSLAGIALTIIRPNGCTFRIAARWPAKHPFGESKARAFLARRVRRKIKRYLSR